MRSHPSRIQINCRQSLKPIHLYHYSQMLFPLDNRNNSIHPFLINKTIHHHQHLHSILHLNNPNNNHTDLQHLDIQKTLSCHLDTKQIYHRLLKRILLSHLVFQSINLLQHSNIFNFHICRNTKNQN